MISLFGIRHHGPGSARSLLNALESLRPNCILVEGPPDADSIIPLATHADMKPPVAILVYLPDNPQQAVYYPFAEFSPEWQSIQYALKNKIKVRFMDLPQKYQLGREETSYEKLVTGNDEPSPDSLLISRNSDPLTLLAQASSYSDFERWWENLIEHRRDSRDLFTGILELMTAARAESENSPTSTDPREAAREAHMRTTIRTAQTEGHENIAVICGAWHTPALTNLDTAAEDEKLLSAYIRLSVPKFAPASVSSTWVPWTFDRLAMRSGYGAGIESPGWYEHIWQTRTALIETWMVKTARLFREEDLTISPAHVIEAVRLAETLATLRGSPLPGLPEINEAILAVFCNGDEIPLRLIHERLIVGIRLGSVPAETPTVPLQRDLTAAQKRTRLEPSASPETLDLDLRKPLLLERSQLLHRLNILGIPWGKLQNARGGKGTFHELWQVEWKPEYAVSVIEASLWGNTIPEAASNRIRSLARDASLPELTRLVESALLADLPNAITGLMERIQREAATSGDIPHLMEALPPLANVLRYGNVRQTDTGMVRHVVNELAERICIGLPPVCSTLDDDAAQEMFERIKAVNNAMSLLEENPHAQDWQRTLTLLAAPSAGHGLTRGLASRLIYDTHADEETPTRMSLALSRGETPAKAAAWVQGFLHSGGMALIHDPHLWKLLDDWLTSLSSDTFSALLPLLRRTFSTFPAPERRQIGELAKNGGLSLQASGAEIDLVRAKKALKLVMTILATEKFETRDE